MGVTWGKPREDKPFVELPAQEPIAAKCIDLREFESSYQGQPRPRLAVEFQVTDPAILSQIQLQDGETITRTYFCSTNLTPPTEKYGASKLFECVTALLRREPTEEDVPQDGNLKPLMVGKDARIVLKKAMQKGDRWVQDIDKVLPAAVAGAPLVRRPGNPPIVGAQPAVGAPVPPAPPIQRPPLRPPGIPGIRS